MSDSLSKVLMRFGVSNGSDVADGMGMWCPGCDDLHAVRLGPNGWAFDGNVDAPTFNPSILVQYGTRPGDRRCHSFVRGGHWEFLSDCTHVLAGQRVPMVALPDGLVG